MRADREVRPRPLSGDCSSNTAVRKLIILVVLGGGLSLYVFDDDKNPLPESIVDKLQDSVAEPLEVSVQQTPETVSLLSGQPKRTAEMVFWEKVERERKETRETKSDEYPSQDAGRQTSFSDLNYTPPKHVNIIQSVPVKASRQTSRAGSKGLKGSKAASVHWDDARGNRTRWKTSFEFENNRIDNSTFCLNVGKGSIPYRECRKGAQQWLKNQCRTRQDISDEWRRMYCQAYGSFRT